MKWADWIFAIILATLAGGCWWALPTPASHLALGLLCLVAFTWHRHRANQQRRTVVE